MTMADAFAFSYERVHHRACNRSVAYRKKGPQTSGSHSRSVVKAEIARKVLALDLLPCRAVAQRMHSFRENLGCVPHLDRLLSGGQATTQVHNAAGVIRDEHPDAGASDI